MRKSVVLATVALQLAIGAVVLGWAVAHWHDRGWAGFAWAAYSGAEVTIPVPWLEAGRLSEGSVLIVDHRSPAGDAGIQVGDVVQQIAGRPADDLGAVRAATRDLATGDRLTITVVREGAELELELTLASSLDSLPIVVGMAVSVLVALGYLAIAVLVAWSRPGTSPSSVFFALATCGAAVFALWAAAEPVLPDLHGTGPLGADPGAGLWMLVVVGLSMVMVNLLLHFALVFPGRRPLLESWPQAVVWLHTLPFLPMVAVAATLAAAAAAGRLSWLTWVIAAAALAWLLRALLAIHRASRRERCRGALAARPWQTQGAVIAACLATLPLLPRASDAAAFLAGVLVVLGLALWFVLVTLGFSLATCIALARSYREAGPEARRQLRWPLWGLAAPVVLSLAAMVAGLAIGMSRERLGIDPMTAQFVLNTLSKLAYVLIPLAFAFGILRYRLMDIDLIIRRTLVYGGLTAFVAVAYLGLVGLLGVTLVGALGLKSQTTVVLATVAVAAACVPVRRWLQNVVDRRMTRRRLDRAAMLERADAAVLGAETLDDLGRELADGLHEALETRTVAIWIVDPSGRRLRPLATVGVPDEARRRGELTVSELPSAGRGAQPVRGALGTVAAVLAAPARLGERVIGLVSVGERRIGDPLDDDDADLVAAVADRLALGAGRLLPREAELDSAEARRIQESLLPGRLPELPGLETAARWAPAREVSGDAYDLLTLPGGRLGVVIADVAGKGMGAALLMSNLQAAVRSTAPADPPPAELARRVRDTVVANLRGGRFVTFCLVVVDPAAARLEWVNLGHEPPLLLRADGRVEELGSTGPAIARVLRGLAIDARRTAIHPGDRLLLCTDGATEAMDVGGEPFGRERLAAVASAAPPGAPALVDAVAAAVHTHCPGALADDLTLVAVSVDRE